MTVVKSEHNRIHEKSVQYRSVIQHKQTAKIHEKGKMKRGAAGMKRRVDAYFIKTLQG